MFLTHASVRVKGSETCFEPVWCSDTVCCKSKALHMHCPFCPITEFYLDPAILRAHYRVKHVDKGIDVFGLKIVRCCDRCDIVGSIKGTKEIRGAHWHCYRCRNGFNRRDEAIKHYRTHFRSPQTTYQIQIVSDVNQGLLGRNRPTVSSEGSKDSNSSDHLNGRQDGTMIQDPSSVAANEIVVDMTLPSNDMAMTLIVDGEGGDVLSAGDTDVVDMSDEVVTADIVSSPSSWTGTCAGDLESRLSDLQCRYDQLCSEKQSMEKRLVREIDRLKRIVEQQTAELTKLRSSCAAKRHDSDIEQSLDKLMEQFHSEYQQLLRQQVADIRQECLRLVNSASFSSSPASHLQSNCSSALISQAIRPVMCTVSDVLDADYSAGDKLIDDQIMSSVGENDAVVSDYEVVAVPVEEVKDSISVEELTGFQLIKAEESNHNGSLSGSKPVTIFVTKTATKRPDSNMPELNGNNSVIVLKHSKLYPVQS